MVHTLNHQLPPDLLRVEDPGQVALFEIANPVASEAAPGRYLPDPADVGGRHYLRELVLGPVFNAVEALHRRIREATVDQRELAAAEKANLLHTLGNVAFR